MSAYLTTATAASTYLATANNLSELTATASTARTNLGLGTAAVEPATKLVPSGGTTGQVLAKASNTSWDLTWATAGGGGGSGRRCSGLYDSWHRDMDKAIRKNDGSRKGLGRW